MTQSIQELEHDIERSRARLDQTIDRIQDRLTVSGVVDELMGSLRTSQFGSVFDDTLAVVRRNPVPVLLVVAGLGWIFYRMTQDEAFRARRRRFAATGAEDIPVLEGAPARGYDPDGSPRLPPQDPFDSGVRA